LENSNLKFESEGVAGGVEEYRRPTRIRRGGRGCSGRNETLPAPPVRSGRSGKFQKFGTGLEPGSRFKTKGEKFPRKIPENRGKKSRKSRKMTKIQRIPRKFIALNKCVLTGFGGIARRTWSWQHNDKLRNAWKYRVLWVIIQCPHAPSCISIVFPMRVALQLGSEPLGTHGSEPCGV